MLYAGAPPAASFYHPGMSWKRLLGTVHLTSLGLWLGTLVMTGVSAAILFPTIKALDPSLPEYDAYDGEHWPIVAGHAANTIFLYSDIIQFVCCLLAMGSLLGGLLLLGDRLRSRSVALRVVMVTAAMCVFGYGFMVHTPSMNTEITAFWRAAKAGDNDVAQRHRHAFGAMHPTSTNLMGATTLLVLGSLIAGAWTSSEGEPGVDSRLEEPALARGRR